jgi:hypothetical protein
MGFTGQFRGLIVQQIFETRKPLKIKAARPMLFGRVSEAFKTLLKDWGKSRDLIFIPQYEYQTLQKTRIIPDGALLHELRVPLGYWEAKDEEDDLEKEIEKKSLSAGQHHLRGFTRGGFNPE